jgi:phenylalanyl-tRNA synthetase beta chain
MKISYNWLKEYISTDLTVEEVSKILTETGLEVDGIEKIEAVKGGLVGVVIGEVITCEKHPDADKLKVTTVNIGTDDLLQIVCGASNVAVGQKVVVATVGCTLYPKPDEAFKIKLSKIRGVESQGMLCAEDELGIGTSHDGILVVNNTTKNGLNAATYFELEDDFQIEIGLTPNRADALGIIGVARDLKAYLNFHKNANLSINLPKKIELNSVSEDKKFSISIENPDLCPRYIGLSIKNVKIDASPSWLQKRLRAVGLSPINNVVDATNFVMRELGTPLHAFDANKLGGKIVVKTAKKGDKFVTLDGVERTLDDTNLMITNGSEYLAIAGVFGGLTSGISNDTNSIFIESAYFNPVSVRKTAKFHGLNTDASFRYERGVDPHLTKFALERVAQIILAIAGGEIDSEAIDVHPIILKNEMIHFRPSYCNKVIGLDIEKDQIKQILKDLDFAIISESENLWKLEAPAYRVDVTREIDVIEEVLRIYGLNNIPFPEKLNTSITLREQPNIEKLNFVSAEFLVSNGFSEIWNNSLSNSIYHENFENNSISKAKNVNILNPLSKDLDVMRQTLLFGALEVVEHNQNRQNADLKLFEFGKVYQKVNSSYQENKRLLVLMTGNLENDQWNSTKEKASFYSIKGIIFSLFERIGLINFINENAIQNELFDDGISITLLKSQIGNIGWISKKMRQQFGIKNEVFVADLDWDLVINSLKLNKTIYKEIPKTFEVRRDYSLLLDEKVKFSEIQTIANKIDKKILKSIGLFDVYEGDKLEKGKKSYAVSFHFQDNEQTLKDEIVDGIMQKIRTSFESELGAQLR